MKNILRFSLRSLGALVFFVLLTPFVLFAQGTWTTASSDSFVGAYGLGSAVVGGKIYVMGGKIYTNILVNTMQVFDPSTNTWTTPTTTGTFTARKNFETAVVDGKIYTIGGDTATDANGIGTTKIEVFDPATNAWSSPTTSGTFGPRRSGSSCVVNGKIYVIGGVSETTILSSVDIFDPSTNHWSSVTPTGTWTPRSGATSSLVNGKVYIVGGLAGFYPNVTFMNTVDVFDPATNVWSILTTTGDFTPRSGLTSAVLAGKIYAIAGYEPANFSKAFEVFDPSTNTWTTPNATGTLTQRQGPTSQVAGGNIYVIGGATGTTDWSPNEFFTPASSGVAKPSLHSIFIELSPNPTTGIITVHNAPENLTGITVMNVLGEKVLDLANPHSANLTLDLSTLTAGIYYARFTVMNSVVVRKIVKE